MPSRWWGRAPGSATLSGCGWRARLGGSLTPRGRRRGGRSLIARWAVCVPGKRGAQVGGRRYAPAVGSAASGCRPGRSRGTEWSSRARRRNGRFPGEDPWRAGGSRWAQDGSHPPAAGTRGPSSGSAAGGRCRGLEFLGSSACCAAVGGCPCWWEPGCPAPTSIPGASADRVWPGERAVMDRRAPRRDRRSPPRSWCSSPGSRLGRTQGLPGRWSARAAREDRPRSGR
jgi:hypothetical protein